MHPANYIYIYSEPFDHNLQVTNEKLPRHNKIDGPEILCVCISVVILLTAAFGFFGNSIIILSFYRYKELRSKRMLLLLSQAVTDQLTSIGIIFGITGRLLCKLKIGQNTAAQSLVIGLLYVMGDKLSQWNLLFIAIERLYATAAPIKYQTIPMTGFLFIATSTGIIWAAGFGVLMFLSSTVPYDRVLSPDSCRLDAIGSELFIIGWTLMNNIG